MKDITQPFLVLGPIMTKSANIRKYIDPRDDTQFLGGGDLCKPPSAKFAAGNVYTPQIESGGGIVRSRSCCCRSGDGFKNENYAITGSPQRKRETANSPQTVLPCRTTTVQNVAIHPARYRSWYRQGDGGDTRQLDASDRKSVRQPLQLGDGNTDSNGEDSPTRPCLPSAGSTEDDAEMVGMKESQEDERSCTSARKRALVRVRLARHRNSLAAAVADANE